MTGRRGRRTSVAPALMDGVGSMDERDAGVGNRVESRRGKESNDEPGQEGSLGIILLVLLVDDDDLTE